MIHILLLILRIIGVILLVVLGAALGLLLAALFIPVRYQVEGSYHGEPLMSARVSWLFRFLAFYAHYGTDGFTGSAKVLGIRLWRGRDKDGVQDLEDGVESVLEDEERSLYQELQQDEENYRRAREGGQEDVRKKPQGDRRENRQEPSRLKDRMARAIRNQWEKLKFSFRRICDKLKGVREFTQEKRAWLEDEKNQASLKLLYLQTKRLLLHLWPRKGRCSLTFGFDDPYTTGQVLQAASLIYPFYHRQLSLYPVFDEKILDGEGRISGRIRLSVVVWLALRILLDRHTRRMLKGFLK